MTFSNHIEELSEKLGDCGLFQWLICLIVDGSAIVWNWSMIQMSFIGQDVKFRCQSLRIDLPNLRFLNLTNIKIDGLCHVDEYATCRSFIFDGNMNTAFSEWALVCDRKWGIAVITTLQMVGVLAGSVCAGQSADTFGRKPTIIFGLIICIIFNVIGCAAFSWEVYAFIRLLIGFGTGVTLTIQFPFLIENVPAWMRSWVISVPCEPICGCLFAFACWLLNDWRKVHLLTACIGLPFVFALLFAPESFRWLVTKNKFKDAKKVVSVIAKVNRVPQPDLTKLFEATESEIGTNGKTKAQPVTSLFKSVEMRSTTLRLSFVWSSKGVKDISGQATIQTTSSPHSQKKFAICCSWYGLALGVKGLSAGLYMSIFLINVVDFPASATGLFVNRFGRKTFLIAILIIAGVVGCSSGGLQNFSVQGVWPTLIALAGKAACAFAYDGLVIYTSEIYPTEIRTIGYGFSSAVGRLGTIVAPNVILLDDYVHGVLYFSSGLLMFVSAFVILPLKETQNTVLKDTILQMQVDES